MARGRFRDAGELRAVMDGLFQMLSDDPQIGPALRRADTPQRFEFTDFGETLDVAPAPAGEPANLRWTWSGDAPWTPAVTMRLKSDVANSFWQGKLNVILATATGKIRMQGDQRKALELGPIIKPVYGRYRQMLADAGHAHLLL
jgi:hypothetical protein